MLVLEEIHKSFVHRGETIEVLRGINLELEAGESLSVIGASGVGKSTLLHIIGSLEFPTKGNVLFKGLNIYQMNQSDLCRFRNMKIGFVFQSHHLLSEFNALENTMMPALIARKDRKWAVEKAREFLIKVGLEKRMTHRTGEMSGGEQQRVAIARALIMKPGLILADEPTGNLDWSTGEEIADLLVRLNREERSAMIIATHNLRLAEKMSTQMEISSGRFK